MGCSVMSELKVDTIVNLAGTGKPNLPVSPTLGGTAISSANTYSYTSSGTEPSSPKNGAIWWDSSNNEVYLYIAGEFKKVTLNASSSSAPAWSGDRGVITGESFTNYEIQYFNIASTSSAADFGNLSVTRGFKLGSCGSSTRGTFGGGYASSRRDEIDYITHSTTGNATDFGNLSVARSYGGAVANGTRGLYAGGLNSAGSYVNTVDYITIANTGNATDFGDLSAANSKRLGSGNNDTRAIFSGGLGGNSSNIIEYFTFASAGNATDFGDLLAAHNGDMQGCSDATRTVFGGQQSGSNVIQYITTATAGNATDFGDFTVNLDGCAGVANLTKGVFAGGITPSNPANNLEIITIQTAGNATDHGDLAEALSYPVACSGAPS